MIDTGTKAYLAGIIDGEGNISWREGKYHAPDVAVTNTDERLMIWLLEVAGGSVQRQRLAGAPGIDGTLHRRDVFKWHIVGYRAVVVLRAVRPWLLLKGHLADDAVGRYMAHLAVMERPARRRHHIDKEAHAMLERGWN